MSENTITLDVRKLLCPLPVIRLQQAILKCRPKDRIIVLATDPGVVYDIPAWCRIHEHKIIQINQETRDISIEIEIK